jgi:hypothetical protein
MEPHVVAYYLVGWLLIIGALLFVAFRVGGSNDDDGTTFFAFGPHPHLELVGLPIHTWSSYWGVVLYTLGSTCFRTLHGEVLSPWIMQRVQTSDAKSKYTHEHATFIVMVSVVFTWLDWFMYLNILLTQLDFLLVEVVGNIVVTLFVTRTYMRSALGYTPIV